VVEGRGRLYLFLLLVSACGGLAKESTRIDGGPLRACRNSLDCAQGMVCDPSIAGCVECVTSADCPANNDCNGRQCVPFVPCKNSLQCPQSQVCNATAGRCVACLTDADCADATTKTCVANACRTKCASDRTCTPMGLLCDLSSGSCAPPGGGTGGTTGAGGTGGSGAGGAGGSGAGGTGGSGAGGSGTGGSDGGTALFFEDFETGGAARWTPSVAADWTVVSDGSLVYKEGTATTDDTWRTSAAGDPTWTDVDVEARVKWLSGGAATAPLVAVCARYQGPTDFYWAGIGAASSVPGSVYIRRRTGNMSVRLIEMAANVTSGVWYTIRLRIVGSTLTMFLDGVQMLTVQDTTISPPGYAAGKIGVASYNATAEFDDVRVTSP